MTGSSATRRNASHEAASRLLPGGAVLTDDAGPRASSAAALPGPAVISLTADGQIASWDEAAARIFGMPPEAAVGRHVETLYLADDVRRGLPGQALRAAAETGRHYEQGMRPRRGGASFWASYLYAARDPHERADLSVWLIVTELARANAHDEEIARLNAALRERSAEFETLLNLMPVGIGVAYDSQCRNIQVNRAFADVLGLHPGQNASKTAEGDQRPTNFRCVDDHGSPIPDDQLPMQVAARDGRTISEMEVDVVHDDGRVIRLLEYASPLLDETGRPRGAVGAFVDITERTRIARQHRFLMALDDALRPLTDAAEITSTAARLLGEYLHVNRCGYADVEADEDAFNVIGDYTCGAPSTVGRHRLSLFGEEFESFMRQNRPHVADDAAVHFPAEVLPTLAAMQIRASVCVPLHKQGRLVAMMAIHQDRPRLWTLAEIELVQQVGSRSWESIERTKVLRRLRESEARFRQLVDAVEDYAIFKLDPQGRVSSWNNGAARILGYATHEILGQPADLFYCVEAQAAGKPKLALRTAADQGRFEEEGRHVRKDGTRFWANTILTAIRDDVGALLGFAQVMRDVTERKRAEEMFRLAVQAAASAILLIDEYGRIIFANTQAESLFGYAQSELLNSPVEMLLPDRSQAEHLAHRAAYAVEPKRRILGAGQELYARRKDGSEFPVEVGLNPIETDEGLIILTSVVDITARKLAVLREREQLAQLAHVGRLSALGEMLSELTHEINQPLAAATNYARACLRYARPPEQANVETLMELVGKSAAQTERASEIVKRLSHFVRKTPPTQSPEDVNRIVRDIISLTAPGYLTEENSDRGLDIGILLDDSLPRVHVDRIQIEQVLLNLTRNALDAMQELPSKVRSLRIQTARTGEFVSVTVADRGVGIAPEHAARLFQPFFTTKAQGVGLGLSISRSIIESHGGKISAAPNPGGGAIFTFTLPIASDASDAHPHSIHH